MPARRETDNVGVRHGRWGEDVAAAFLVRGGYAILARNVRPCAWDRRYELDLVARDPDGETMVFVEVKQSARRSEFSARLHRIDRRKKRLLRIAANAYRRYRRHDAGYRFDVVEVYGVPEGGPPEIDHIEGVRLFVPQDRFVRWS